MEDTTIKCVMCNEPAKYKAEAKYKSGTIDEPLCGHCFENNLEIKRNKNAIQ